MELATQGSLQNLYNESDPETPLGPLPPCPQSTPSPSIHSISKIEEELSHTSSTDNNSSIPKTEVEVFDLHESCSPVKEAKEQEPDFIERPLPPSPPPEKLLTPIPPSPPPEGMDYTLEHSHEIVDEWNKNLQDKMPERLPKSSPLPSEIQKKSPPERMPERPQEWHVETDKTKKRHRNAPSTEEAAERHPKVPKQSEEIPERHRKHNTHEGKERHRHSTEGGERHHKHQHSSSEEGHRRRKKHHSPSHFAEREETQHQSLPNNPALEELESNYPDLQVFHNSIRELQECVALPPTPPGEEADLPMSNRSSPCDCPAHIHDRESPLEIAQELRDAVRVSRTLKSNTSKSKKKKNTQTFDF